MIADETLCGHSLSRQCAVKKLPFFANQDGANQVVAERNTRWAWKGKMGAAAFFPPFFNGDLQHRSVSLKSGKKPQVAACPSEF